MKECKDMDPGRTDRVSVWINKADKLTIIIYELIPNIGIDINYKKYIGRYIDKFQILR